MTLAIIPTGDSTESVGLAFWMDRVLERARKIEPRWRSGDIHDLRVALRRCRTIAEALQDVNPTPGWRKIKNGTGDLFHTLGDLRDTQVADFWVRKLAPTADPVRIRLLRVFSQKEKRQRKLAGRALADFDRKNWRKWKRRLEPKARFFPLESIVFQRIALARLSEAFDLYQEARRKRSSVAWHRVRIGIKRFRYVVENFLPRRYGVWAPDLKRFQDILGELHDLDVLRVTVQRGAKILAPADVARWLSKIDGERNARLDELLQKSAAPDSPWMVWRDGLRTVHVLAASPTQLERRTA